MPKNHVSNTILHHKAQMAVNYDVVTFEENSTTFIWQQRLKGIGKRYMLRWMMFKFKWLQNIPLCFLFLHNHIWLPFGLVCWKAQCPIHQRTSRGTTNLARDIVGGSQLWTDMPWPQKHASSLDPLTYSPTEPSPLPILLPSVSVTPLAPANSWPWTQTFHSDSSLVEPFAIWANNAAFSIFEVVVFFFWQLANSSTSSLFLLYFLQYIFQAFLMLQLKSSWTQQILLFDPLIKLLGNHRIIIDSRLKPPLSILCFDFDGKLLSNLYWDLDNCRCITCHEVQGGVIVCLDTCCYYRHH